MTATHMSHFHYETSSKSWRMRYLSKCCWQTADDCWWLMLTRLRASWLPPWCVRHSSPIGQASSLDGVKNVTEKDERCLQVSEHLSSWSDRYSRASGFPGPTSNRVSSSPSPALGLLICLLQNLIWAPPGKKPHFFFATGHWSQGRSKQVLQTLIYFWQTLVSTASHTYIKLLASLQHTAPSPFSEQFVLRFCLYLFATGL